MPGSATATQRRSASPSASAYVVALRRASSTARVRTSATVPALVFSVSAHSIPSTRTPGWTAARSTQRASSSKSLNFARVVVWA